jgi:hypothetical protein
VRRCVDLLNSVRGRKFFCGFNGGAPKVIVRLATLLLLVATSAGLAEDSSSSPLEQRGRALAERMCSTAAWILRFTREDARAFLLYLRSIQAP